eukprot:UN26818
MPFSDGINFGQPARKSQGPNDRKASKMMQNSRRKKTTFLLSSKRSIYIQMGPNCFLSIPWGSKNISNTQDMLFENFIHFENLTFLKLQAAFLSFDVFHSK